MNTNDIAVEMIREYIAEFYDPEHGSNRSTDSEGNYGDVFSDGQKRGRCLALWDIAEILGLEVDPPQEQQSGWW
jgi:hypothetical protein